MAGEVFIFGAGGGGVGGILTVTAPAGVAVSVSKDRKTKRKSVNAEGIAVFKGLATGTWTLTITDGDRTATKPVSITADYSTMIAFFAATINIAYPAGSTCTCSDGNTTLTAPDTSGAWSCIVPNTGTWTISITDGTNTASESIYIAANGQIERVDVSYLDYVIHNGILEDGYRIDTTTATYSVVDGCLVFKSTKASNGNGSIKITENGQSIDFTNRSILYFDVSATSPRSGTSDYVRLSVTGGSSVQKNIGSSTPLTRQTIPIDIEAAASGEIGLFISDNPETVELKVYNMWFA